MHREESFFYCSVLFLVDLDERTGQLKNQTKNVMCTDSVNLDKTFFFVSDLFVALLGVDLYTDFDVLYYLVLLIFLTKNTGLLWHRQSVNNVE